MWWIAMGLGSVAGVVVLRILLRQVRELLLDVGDVVRAWTEVLPSTDDREGRRAECCAARYRCPGSAEVPRCLRRLK